MQNSRVSRKILGTLIVLGWLGAFLTIMGEVGSQSLAQSDVQTQQPYKVEFATPGSKNLPDQAKTAIINATSAWRGAQPPNNTFLLVNVEWYDDWAIGTLATASDQRSSTPSVDSTTIDNVRVTPHNMIAFILVRTPNGWQAALDVDPNAQHLLLLIPDSELSSESEQAIFPSNQQVRVQNQVQQQQYSNYKFPWRAGETWYRATGYEDLKGCQGGWHDAGGNCGGKALDFYTPGGNSEILAAASGTVTYVCKNSDQAYIIVQTQNTTENLIYVHLKANSLTVSQGQKVSQGQYLGIMAKPSNQGCGDGTFVHLHLQFPTKPFTIDGYTFTSTNTYKGVILKSTNGLKPPVPADKGIVKNRDFDEGFANWSKRGDANWDDDTDQFGNPILEISYDDGGKNGAVYQDLNVSTKDGQTGEASFYIGNSADVPRTMRVLLRDSEPNKVELSCTFIIPPHTLLQQYMLVGRMKTWTNLRIEFQPRNNDGVSGLRIDLVRVYYRKSINVQSTQCYTPTLASHWVFSSELNGWNTNESVHNHQFADNGLKFTVRKATPLLYSPTFLDKLASKHAFVWVKMKSSTDECGQLFFKRDIEGQFGDDRKLAYKPHSDKQSYIYVFQAHNHPLWTDNIVQLRLDPACNPLTSNPFPTGKYNEILIEAIGISGPNKLKNRGFETIGTGDNTTANGWSVNKPSAIQRVCNEPEQPVIAKSGSCALRVVGQTGGNAIARQTIASIKAVAGDLLIVSGAVTATNLPEGKGKVVAIITYTDGSIQKLTTKFDTGTYPYQDFANTLLLTQKVKNVRIDLVVAGEIGQFTVDDLGVATGKSGLSPALKSVTHTDGLIPLPAAPTDLRGN